jgi:hypothetical protein
MRGPAVTNPGFARRLGRTVNPVGSAKVSGTSAPRTLGLQK